MIILNRRHGSMAAPTTINRAGLLDVGSIFFVRWEIGLSVRTASSQLVPVAGCHRYSGVVPDSVTLPLR